MLLLLLPFLAVLVTSTLGASEARGLKPLVSNTSIELYRYPERTARRLLPPTPCNEKQVFISGSCTNCDTTNGKSCASCTIDQYTCTSCIKTWQYLRTSDQKCNDCDQSCRTCSANPTNCTSCYKEYALTASNTCQPICKPNEYFVSSNSTCVQCGSFCAACIDNTNCLLCKPGYTLEGGTVCKRVCGVGFFRDTDYLVCLPCHPNCKTCVDITSCLTCTNTSASTSDGCVKVGSTYLIGFVGGTSTPCDPTCQSCTDVGPNKCLTCVRGRYLSSGTCNPNGGTGCFYWSPTNTSCILCRPDKRIQDHYCQDTNLTCSGGGKYRSVSLDCVSCHPSCQSCDGGGNLLDTFPGSCGNCISSYVKQTSGSTCVPNGDSVRSPDGCSNGFQYRDSSTNNCQNCEATCAGCSGPSESQCTYCFAGFTLMKGNCVDSYNFISNMYTKGGINAVIASCASDANKFWRASTNDCANCHVNCATCSGQRIRDCTSCRSDAFLDGYTGLCRCKYMKYFDSAGNCVSCGQYCASCTSPTTCTECLQGYTLNGGVCGKDCPSSQYAVYLWTSTTATCLPCDSTCLTCSSGTDSDCLTCVSGMTLTAGKCQGAPTCTSSQYFNGTICTACNASCLTCSSASYCQTCAQNRTMYANGICSCTPNQYFDLGLSLCKVCVATCTTCQPNDGAKCLSCITGYQLAGNVCNPVACTAGTVNVSGTCTPCHGTCSNCSDILDTGCDICKNNLTKIGGKCRCSSAGQYLDTISITCQACSSFCTTCTSSTSCTMCDTTHELVAGKCLVPCGSTQYRDLNSACQDCGQGCLSCTGYSCTACDNGYSNLMGVCVSACLSHEYPTSSTTCGECDASCKTCDASGSSGCTSCDLSLEIAAKQCLTPCRSAQYRNRQLCTACPEGCTACTGATSCTACQIGYSVVSGICNKTCTSAQYRVNATVCSSCDGSCVTCNSSGSTGCTSCLVSHTLVQGKCLSPPNNCLTPKVSGAALNCQVCETGYEVTNLGQCAPLVACNLPSMMLGGECVGPIQGKDSYSDDSGMFSVVFDREMKLANSTAVVKDLFKVTVLDRSGKIFDSAGVGETKLSGNGKALETHLTITANLINGSVMLEQTNKSVVALYSSAGYLDPQSTPKTTVTYIADGATATLTSAAGAMSSVAGPVASAALVAATPLSATSGTLLEKVSNFFQFLAVLNGRDLYLPQLILDAVGISMLPPIFDNYMQIDEDTVSCQPPSKYVQNQQSCNMLNNYGKELQFIALITVIVTVITTSNHLAVKNLKPESFVRKCLAPIAASFGPAYVVIVFEGSNLEMFGVSLLHLRTAFSSKCQSYSMVAAVVLLLANLAIVYYAWIFTMDVMPKVPGLAEKYSSAQNRSLEADKQLREAKKSLVSSNEQVSPDIIAKSAKAKRELKAVLEDFEIECRKCKAGVLAFLLDGYHPNALKRAMFVPLINLVRNLASQLVVVFLADLGQTQVWLVFIVQTAFTIFRASVRPRRDHAEDYVDILSHALFALYMGLVAIVNLGVPEETAQGKFGLVMAAVLVLIALINIIFIIFVIGKSIYLLFIEAMALLKKKKMSPLDQEAKSISPNDDSVLTPLTVGNRLGRRARKDSDNVTKKKVRSQIKEPADIHTGPSSSFTTLKRISKKSGINSKQSTTTNNTLRDANNSNSSHSSSSSFTKSSGLSKVAPVKSHTLKTSSTNAASSSLLRDRSKEVIVTASSTVFIQKPKLVKVVSNKSSESPDRSTTQAKR